MRLILPHPFISQWFPFRDRWNILDFTTLVIFAVIFFLRMDTLSTSRFVIQNSVLAAANHLYGLNTMFLTLRVIGQILETLRRIGPVEIALFKIIRDVATIFWQFLAVILAFSLAITKVFLTERSYIKSPEKANTQYVYDFRRLPLL